MKYTTFLYVNMAKYLDPVREQIEFWTVFPLRNVDLFRLIL